jgi:hypothetical protein
MVVLTDVWPGWQECRLLSKADLQGAMDRVRPAIKYRKGDNIAVLTKALVEGMRGRDVQASTEPGAEQAGGERLSGKKNSKWASSSNFVTVLPCPRCKHPLTIKPSQKKFGCPTCNGIFLASSSMCIGKLVLDPATGQKTPKLHSWYTSTPGKLSPKLQLHAWYTRTRDKLCIVRSRHHGVAARACERERCADILVATGCGPPRCMSAFHVDLPCTCAAQARARSHQS